jgi:hypothetical protein
MVAISRLWPKHKVSLAPGMIFSIPGVCCSMKAQSTVLLGDTTWQKELNEDKEAGSQS